MTAVAAPSRVLFVTGKLAEPALRSTLADDGAAVRVRRRDAADHRRGADDDRRGSRGILEVARRAPTSCSFPGSAKATPRSIARSLRRARGEGPEGSARDPRVLRPGGRARGLRRVGHRDPRRDQQRAAAVARGDRARGRRTSATRGADVIDIGCTPGLAFPALGDVVRELVAAGMRVSIDTLRCRRDPHGGRRRRRRSC